MLSKDELKSRLREATRVIREEACALDRWAAHWAEDGLSNRQVQDLRNQAVYLRIKAANLELMGGL